MPKSQSSHFPHHNPADSSLILCNASVDFTTQAYIDNQLTMVESERQRIISIYSKGKISEIDLYIVMEDSIVNSLGSDPKSLAGRPSKKSDLLGQVYTPEDIANMMAVELLKDRSSGGLYPPVFALSYFFRPFIKIACKLHPYIGRIPVEKVGQDFLFGVGDVDPIGTQRQPFHLVYSLVQQLLYLLCCPNLFLCQRHL